MGLFSYDFYGSGGSGESGPRKTGLARLWEIFMRDSLKLFGAGALAVLSVPIYAVGMMISIDSHALLPMLITCPLGGMLAAPQLCGMSDTILRSLRDKSSFWWMTYRWAWKHNVKGSLLPGAVGGLLFGFQLFIFSQFDRVEIDLFLFAAMLFGVMVSAAIATWLLPQIVLMELPLRRAVLNSVLLSVRHPLRTLGATLLQLIYWGFIVIAFPQTLVLFLLLNFWLPMLIATMLIYNPLDETFHIEDELEARDDALYGNPDNPDSSHS